MEKLSCIFFIHLFTVTSLFSQTSFDKKTLEEFQSTKNDSLFINKYSDVFYHLGDAGFFFGGKSGYDTLNNQFHKDLLNGTIGQISGPYTTDTSVFYMKIISADTAYETRVGNIWINIKQGRELALATATKIFNDIEAGKDYNECCALYSEDKNKNLNCDLGWVYDIYFVKPFSTEIINHKKGDIFLVETSFGFHIVKILENSYKERKGANYVCLTKLKKH